MQLAYNLKGAVTLFIALVNACIAFVIRSRQSDAGFLFTALIGMALAFVSITIPIQLDGTFITLLWATEMVVLLWIFIKFRFPVYEYFTIILVFLTIISFLMDIEDVLVAGMTESLLMNGTFMTGLFAGLAFGVFSWLMEREKELFRQAANLKYIPFSVIALFAGCGIVYLSFIVDFHRNIIFESLSDCSSLAFSSLTLFLVLAGMRKRFPIERCATVYAILAGLSAGFFLWLSAKANGSGYTSLYLLQWGVLVVLIAHLSLFAKWYYASFDFRRKSSDKMTSFIAVISTVLLAVAVNNMLYLTGLQNESSAALSISLSIAGFILMALGMRLHLKILRMISLVVFGLVLLKLVIVDLWLLPTVGKIIVFIMLGVILLVLSFLYQKLKKVLFMDNQEEGTT
ncbi:MAG: DUF2339 domain-containing protein [Parabacteroides sp.]